MKVAILIDRHNVGGVEKIAIEQVKALRRIGVDATLLVLTQNALIKGAFKDLLKGVPVVFLDKRLPKFLRFSFKFPVFHFFSFFHLSYPLLVPWVIKKDEFDYIIPHGTFTTFSAVSIRLIKGIPYSSFIWDPIGYILGRVYKDSFHPFLLKILLGLALILDKMVVWWADAVLVGGKVHNRYFNKLKKKIQIAVIPPAVHPAKSIAKKKQDYVLMVTAWKRGKNPDYIFEIVKKIPDIKIKMVGKWLDPAYKKEFAQKVKKNGLSQNIEVVGAATEKELSSYYKKALVLLQTNDDRGFGMPALEAAAHGTTFIIPKGQGVCDLFTHNKHGFYTTEKDTKTIVKILKDLLNKKEKAVFFGIEAYNQVKSNYSWEQHAKKIISQITR